MARRESNFDRMNRQYGTPAKRGMAVKYKGHPATITSCTGSHLRLRFNPEVRDAAAAGGTFTWSGCLFHPLFEIDYLDGIDYAGRHDEVMRRWAERMNGPVPPESVQKGVQPRACPSCGRPRETVAAKPPFVLCSDPFHNPPVEQEGARVEERCLCEREPFFSAGRINRDCPLHGLSEDGTARGVRGDELASASPPQDSDSAALAESGPLPERGLREAARALLDAIDAVNDAEAAYRASPDAALQQPYDDAVDRQLDAQDALRTALANPVPTEGEGE